MIDRDSPSGSYAKAIAAQEKRTECNARIVAMNARIKAAWGKEHIADIAAREGVGVDYVRIIGGRFGQ